MPNIYGALGVDPAVSRREFANTIGQRAVYDAVNQVLSVHSNDLAQSLAVFVEKETWEHKFKYILPGGGRLQRNNRQGRALAVNAQGEWNVALPLEDFGAQIAADRVAWGYMRLEDLDVHLKTVITQDINTVRYELFKAIVNSTAATFEDEHKGTLTIERLANGDGVLYPPVIGSEAPAAENHYLESGYAASAISDTNDPLITIINELEEHFGTPNGGSEIAIFINQAQTAKITALANFVEYTANHVVPGDNTPVVSNIPEVLQGGSWRYLGTYNGAHVLEWRIIPANYLLGVHLEAPAPLIMRVDPEDTGLGTGLQLVSESDTHPFSASHYSHRFGFGVGNRLNGVVMELGTGGTYTPPAGF